MATRASRHTDKIPQLSCELCRECKVKCDKLSPCSNCKKAGVACVPVHRKRLPRGRHVHNASLDVDLRDRIGRLEALITNLDSTGALSTSSSSTQLSELTPGSDTSSCATVRPNPTITKPPSLPTPPKKAEAGRMGRYMAKHFWEDLVEEIHGLRGIIGPPSDDDEDHGQAHNSSQLSPADVTGSVVGINSSRTGDIRSVGTGFLALRPAPAVCNRLCQVYLRQVDPIIKILHRPSLGRFMLDGNSYLCYEEGHFSVEALVSAVCYSAIGSMTEEQCQSMFHASKSNVGADYRVACERAVERAGLITTNDITVLQAFVLYLLATHAQDKSRVVWTLVPVAVRIARALSLHVDDHRPSESFFEQQMRKRLWYTICLLDLQASFDRASEPLITPDSPQPSMPQNVNDSEFEPSFKGDLPDREGLTDITFALVTYDAQASGKILNFDPTSEMAKGASGAMYNWDVRQRHVEQFEHRTVKLLRYCDPCASPYAWFTLNGSQSIVATMKLCALRPLHRNGSGAPPRVHGSSHLLELSASVLEKAYLIRSHPHGEGFRWFEVAQWHALAIAIAECYVCNDSALVGRLWPLIEDSFEHHGNVIADYTKGMLWRPMEKLMRQTRNRVSRFLSLSGGRISASSSSGVSRLRQDPGLSLTTSPVESMTPVSMTSQQLPMSLDFTMAVTEAPATTTASSQAWHPPNDFAAQESTSQMGGVLQTIFDPAWGIWESFVNDLSFEDVAGARTPASTYDSHFGSGMLFRS